MILLYYMAVSILIVTKTLCFNFYDDSENCEIIWWKYVIGDSTSGETMTMKCLHDPKATDSMDIDIKYKRNNAIFPHILNV